MTNNTLYIFPDTNLFIQCRPLGELDWSDWAEYKEIHLVVCRPVQREIDEQKKHGNNRVARHARATYKLFRDIIRGQQGYHLVRGSNPIVKLYLEGLSLPSQDLKGVLDYSKPDDEVIGCLHRFLKDNPDVDALLLTHDGGPMMTANSLGIPYVAVKDDWLLAPENNELERENAKLRARVAELEHTEPKFKIWLVNDAGKEGQSIDAEYHVYKPMSGEEVAACMRDLQGKFPLATDFGSPDPEDRDGGFVASGQFIRRVYTPATDEAIVKYRDEDYPKWTRKCEDFMLNLHDTLQAGFPQPSFTFMVANEGTRPARDTLINLISGGSLKVCPPPVRLEDEAEEDNTEASIPDPPMAPKGTWRVQSSRDYFTSALLASVNPFSGLMGSQSLRVLSPTLLPGARSNPRRDPNGFYYKPKTSVGSS